MDEIKNKDCMRLLDEIVALYGPINNRETEYPDGFIKAMFVARYNELIQRHCLNQAIFEKLTDLDGGMDDGDLPKFQRAVAELKLLLLKKGRNNVTALEVKDNDVLKAGGIAGLGYGVRGAVGTGIKGLAKGGVIGAAGGLGLGYGANALKNKVQRNIETRRLRKEYERANNIYASALPNLIKPIKRLSKSGEQGLREAYFSAKTLIEKGAIAKQMKEAGMRPPFRRNRLIASEIKRSPYLNQQIKDKQFEDRLGSTFAGGTIGGLGAGILGSRLAGRGGAIAGGLTGLAAGGYLGHRLGKYINKQEDERIKDYSNSDLRHYLTDKKLDEIRSQNSYQNLQMMRHDLRSRYNY